MSTNSNFTVAVHILTLIAHHARPLSSSFIAGSVNTNPVTIRKLVGILRDANLVRTLPGSTGGTVLTRPPREITLGDVYDLFREETLFGLYPDDPNHQCIVGRNLQHVLLNIFGEADMLLRAFLETISLEQIRDIVLERDNEMAS